MSTPSTRDQLAAISEGTRDAVIVAMRGPNAPVFEAIRDGVKQAFDQLWASQIADAIADGVREAFKLPPDLVLDAIRSGAKAALVEAGDE